MFTFLRVGYLLRGLLRGVTLAIYATVVIVYTPGVFNFAGSQVYRDLGAVRIVLAQLYGVGFLQVLSHA